MLFLPCMCYAFVRCLVVTCLERADILTSWISFVMSNCDAVTFSIDILGQVWCLIVSIPDLCHFFLTENAMNVSTWVRNKHVY